MKTVTVTLEHDISASVLGKYILDVFESGVQAAIIRDGRTIVDDDGSEEE